MYEFIKGALIEKNPSYVVLENNGIGYLVNISLNTFSKIKDSKEAKLFIHFHVREDAQVLFGFFDGIERELFRYLLSVSGVGASTARLILSSLTTEELYSAITQGQPSVLQTVKGIGGKTAQRIVIDLKDKLTKAEIKTEKVDFSHNTLKDEALSGLMVLGFNKANAEKAINRVLQKGVTADVESLIKEALKVL
ncbi:MAG TPA: Holliday junction branch migration protein RuvA [Bacteroidetes bacterium]|nr:MAG: Holliday junction branch migration protein RuvA [Bacteroidota bacterium]RLD84204.1 MAG: Holliday junction branch migration protein RuvA [Bacteroidota bacterium]HHL58011.1 Holliday junction branch migration protein RuvA [Bacteroidota bacterium]